MKLCPARLDPIFSPRPWGALSLAPFFPEKSNLAEPVGEAWMTGNDCRFASSPFTGKTLGEAWREMPREWTGTLLSSNRAFPLLVKFLFVEDKLSVQVHPDDEYAARHEQAAGGCGKTEMWYALGARSGAEVMVGLKPGVTPDLFKRAIAENTAEDCLAHIPLHDGDSVFVPARTAHTIGPGLILCEIQEHSDITYRVYDYNRRDAKGQTRALHIEKALDVIEFGEQRGGKINPVRMERGVVTETHLAACKYFVTDKWEFSRRIERITSCECFELLIFLAGAGTIGWGAESADYAPGQVWMIPAALGAFEVIPKSHSSLLRTYVPGNLDEYAQRLASQGINEEMLSRLVHK